MRFPGLGRYGAFGDVDEAQAAVDAAQLKVSKAQADVNKQKKLITFTQDALRQCTAGPTAVAFLTAGASVAVCVAEQETALGQRKGVLGQFDLILSSAKDELKDALTALAQAKAQAREVPPEEEPVITTTHVDSSGNTVTVPHTSTSSSAKGGSGGMFSNPMMIAAVAVPVLGVLAYVMTRRKSAVAGYGRRRSRRSRR